MLVLHSRAALSVRSLAFLSMRRHYCKDYDSDDEKDTKQKHLDKSKSKQESLKEVKSSKSELESESAAARLNRLLASMQADDNTTFSNKPPLDLARPGEGNKKRKEAIKKQAADKDVFAAAKRVASLLGETDQKQTESELLSKLLGQNVAVDGVQSKESGKKTPEEDLSLSELIVSMKIDRTKQPTEQSRADFVRQALSAKRSTKTAYGKPATARATVREPEAYTGSVNLFGGETLGIFKDPSTLRESPDMLSTWSQLQDHELQIQVAHPPTNYMEKLINWTEEGKVWRFPIDNEQDWTEEVDVDFSEHIFLEQHLEPWCPNKGPIRHFMELVCVGLSKNPYITAKDKKEHILWYRDYFESKKDLLKDLMNKEKMETAGKQKLEA